MPWVYLFFAGVFEVVWATSLKLSQGFAKPLFAAATVAFMIVSFCLLAQAMKVLPLGTSYAIWTGIGALGAMIVGIVFFKEPLTAPRMLFALLLLIGIVGLKCTATS